MQETLKDYITKLITTEYDQIAEKSFQELAALQFAYTRKQNALYIRNIQSYSFAFLTNLLSSRERFAAVLGCEPNSMHEKYLSLLQQRVKPKEVAYGRCQENVMLGAEVDLNMLPVLKYSELDVGPYITAGSAIAKDPETKARNVSIHRMQVKGKNKLGIRLEPTSHLFQMQRKSECQKKDLEVAVVIGNHPAELIAAVSSLEYGADELEVAGAIRGEPLELVKCKTVDLEVPASAEIIIEGYIPHEEKEMEGPFGDFMGYYIEPGLNHIMIVTAITFCREPIFQSIRAGSLEDTLLFGFAKEVTIYKALTEKGIKVGQVNLSPMIFNCAIAIEKQSDVEPDEAIKAAFESYSWLKYCVIVDQDVNCYDLNDVWWAMATRSTPKNIVQHKEIMGFPRDPYEIHQGKIGIDATVPLKLREKFLRAQA